MIFVYTNKQKQIFDVSNSVEVFVLDWAIFHIFTILKRSEIFQQHACFFFLKCYLDLGHFHSMTERIYVFSYAMKSMLRKVSTQWINGISFILLCIFKLTKCNSIPVWNENYAAHHNPFSQLMNNEKRNYSGIEYKGAQLNYKTKKNYDFI